MVFSNRRLKVALDGVHLKIRKEIETPLTPADASPPPSRTTWLPAESARWPHQRTWLSQSHRLAAQRAGLPAGSPTRPELTSSSSLQQPRRPHQAGRLLDSDGSRSSQRLLRVAAVPLRRSAIPPTRSTSCRSISRASSSLTPRQHDLLCHRGRRDRQLGACHLRDPRVQGGQAGAGRREGQAGQDLDARREEDKLIER